MKDIFRSTLDLIAQWPEEKFQKFKPYMKQEFDPRDFRYLLQKRDAIKSYDQSHPRSGFTTLVKRPFRANV